MTAKNKKILLLSIFGLIILTLAYFQNEKEISLSRNKALTIGKVTELNTCSKTTTKCIVFKYFINGKWINGTDRGDALWPKLVREGKPQVGKYYPVEYDKTNIEYSKIMITKQPLTDKQVEKYLN
ncbi:MAG: hypothetical protein ABJK28_00025 [Algibacter sp.]